MVQNVGMMDRAARATAAVAMLIWAWKKDGKPGVVAACGAGMLLSSAASGYCTLYGLLNINTRRKPA